MTKGTQASKGGQKGGEQGRLPATPPRRSARVNRALEGETTETESAGKGRAPDAGGSPIAVAAPLAVKHEPKASRKPEQLTGAAPTLKASGRSAKAPKGEGGSTAKGPAPKVETPGGEAQDSPDSRGEGDEEGDTFDPLHTTSYAQIARVATAAGSASQGKGQPGGTVSPTPEKGQPGGDAKFI